MLDKIRTDPLYRAILEGALLSALGWSSIAIWGPALGLILPTSGSGVFTFFWFLLYVGLRGVYLARMENKSNDSE